MKSIKGFTIDDITLYNEEVPIIPIKSPFGNLGEKYIFLMYRLQYINDTIKELYDLNQEYFDLRKYQQYDNNINLKILHRVLRFSTEIKIIMDEMITLYYILEFNKPNGEWPNKIEIDSIGRYLCPKNSIKYKLFDKHISILETINSIGNAIKHSFVNSEITWIRSKIEVPLLLGYYQKQNDLKYKVEFHYIELPKFIDDFNILLDEYRYDLKHNYTEQSYKYNNF